MGGNWADLERVFKRKTSKKVKKKCNFWKDGRKFSRVCLKPVRIFRSDTYFKPLISGHVNLHVQVYTRNIPTLNKLSSWALGLLSFRWCTSAPKIFHAKNRPVEKLALKSEFLRGFQNIYDFLIFFFFYLSINFHWLLVNLFWGTRITSLGFNIKVGRFKVKSVCIFQRSTLSSWGKLSKSFPFLF